LQLAVFCNGVRIAPVPIGDSCESAFLTPPSSHQEQGLRLMLDGLNVGDYMLSVWSRTALLHRGECVAKGTCTSDDRIEVPFKVLPDPAWHWHVEAPLHGEPSPGADVAG
jgi:hypothetical protein